MTLRRAARHAQVSSALLGVEDASLSSMEVLCQDPPHPAGLRLAGQAAGSPPTAPGLWHRDFFPARCAPLESWAADAAEAGAPTYIQWNVALFDDDVLHVAPGTHHRPADPAQEACLRSGGVGSSGRGALSGMLPGGERVVLRAGDGVVYINQIIHRAGHYDGNSAPERYVRLPPHRPS